jgi:type VI secretion system VasD/TssJ family lipoprotein
LAHLVLAVVLAVLVGCGAGQKTGPGASQTSAEASRREASSAAQSASAPEAPLEGDVIGVMAAASKGLNTFNNQPHTVVLVLYQLTHSSAFSQLLETPEGKAKLLAGEAFDGSVLSRRRVVVQPGATQQIVLDRIEGARHLAAVAGFYNAEAKDMGRLMPIVAQKSGALFWKKPKPLVMRLDLGDRGFGP